MSQSAPDKRSISLADGLAASASVAVFIIGICAILGWHLGIIDLVRPFPSYGSMKHNTALGLMLSGFGMGALLFDRTAWARIASLLVVGIAAATLTQLVTGVDLGIDQLLVLDPVPSAFPGRPAANTAFALLCIGVALFVAAFPPSRHRAALVGVLASLVLTIVMAATLGFATGTEYAYTWLGLGQMAPHTAAGLGIAALGLFRFAWEDANAHALGPSWLPSACFIGGITLSIILGASLRVSERQQNQRADQLQAENVAREVRTRFWSPVFSLLRMAERWTLTEQPSKERFEISSRLNFRDFHGLEAMEIVDPEGEIVWTSIAPDAPDATSIALSPPHEAMLRARDTKLPIAAFPDLGTASNRLFQVLVPVESGGRFVAFIVGVFDAAAVLDTLESFAPGYGITILADAKPVFERTQDATDDPAMAEAAFDWAGATWRVRVEPGAKALDRIRSGLPETALIGGLSLSLLLALSVFLAQKAARGEQRAVLANRRMERLWSSGVVGIFDIRLDGSVIQANDEMLRILGYDRADIASGRLRWDGLTPPEHAAADARALEELDATDVASLYEKELFRKDGSRIPVLTGIAVVDPALRDGVVLVLDQTARHRAEEAASRLASIVESSEDAIMSAALDFTITSWNAGATRLYGYTAEEMIGGGTGSLIPPDRLEATQEAVAQVAQGGRLTQFESIRVRKDGTRIEVSMTISPVRDASGRVIGVSAIAHDISLRKRAEEELRQAKETAESADRAKSAFVANISHELRTPLNGILGMLDLCLDTALDDVQLGQIQTARRAAEALLVIVNDLLDIAKIEAGKLDIESIEFDLRDCLRDTMHSLQLSARQKLLEFSRYVAPDVPSLVMGDPGRLRQILVNLAGNAIKFTEQGEVSVACSIVSRTPDTAVVRLTVEDTGIGIPVEQQRAIFEPFAQADSSTTRRFGGTGLGLSISRLLIEKMGGQLALESEPGRGSRFSIELSLPVVRWEASLVLASLPAAIRGLRVLVVDDSAAVRAELEGWLASWQMRPDVVENASQALASLEAADVARDPFRLVLIDAELPETDGFALARSIRARSSPGDTTLLLLTRGGSPGDARRCADLSIRAYLRKPIDSSSCLEAILQSVADPALAGSNARLVTRHSLREQLGTMRILLVEDNAFNEAVAVQLLERQGVTVSVARNGATAVEAVREGRFDLVLMDVQMPVMDGMAATRAIRSDERGTDRHVPVIAMTARAMTGDRQACLDAGMDAYLPKPLDHKDLLRTIERLGLKRGVAPALPVELPAIGAGATSTIDRETLLKKVGGDVEFLGGLLDLFAVQASELLTDLREGLAEGNAESVRFAAHAIKGSIGNWTTGRPYELARDLEEGSPENAKDLFHSLETELALLERTLRDVEQDLRRSPGAPKSL